MNQPSLTDFGLQPEDIKRAETAKKVLIVISLICMVAGLVYSDNVKGSSVWLIVFVLPPIGPFILYFSLKALLRGFWPMFSLAMRYASACEAYEKWWARTQSQFWTSLSGLQFEHELAALFRRTGKRAEVTRANDDKGVDIWLVQGERRIPVQCKAHKNPIGPAAARELFGTMQHFGAEEGILASLSGFTRGVHEYVRGKPIRLLVMRDILQMQKEVR